MIRRILPYLCVTLLVIACTKPRDSGLVITTSVLRDANLQAVAEMPCGSLVEYIGEEPRPVGADGGPLKVKFGDKEGYVDAEWVCFGCTAGAIISDTHTPFAITLEGDFVGIDSTFDGNYRIHRNSMRSWGFVPVSAVSVEPGDVAVAAAIERMGMASTDFDRLAILASVSNQYPSSRLLQFIKVDMSEATDAYLAEVQESHGRVLIDKKQNALIMTKNEASIWANAYLLDIFRRSEGWDDPRVRYFYNYMSYLPDFVKLNGKSEAMSWKMGDKLVPGMAYFLYRLNRSPENINYLYNTFKPLIIEALGSPELFDVRQDAGYLVKAYEGITAIPNHEQLIKKISEEVAQWDRKHTGKDGYISGYYILDEQKDIYEPILNEDLIPDAGAMAKIVWCHSFWVRRFNEGNQSVVYNILEEVSKIERREAEEYVEGDGEGEGDYYDGADERGDAETGYETFTCIFQEYSIGDCGHMLFSCGDYGDADISNLPAEAQALWNNLVISDSEGERGNPEYVGKEFTITVGTTTGPACNEGQGGEGQVPMIVEFKLNE